MKQKIAYVLLLTLLAASVSCGDSGVADDTSPDTSDDVTTKPDESMVTPTLPDKTYDGYTFTIYQRSVGSDRLYTDEYDEGDIVGEAVYESNRAVEEHFGIELERVFSTDKTGMDALNTILANEDAYDIVIPHGRSAFGYATEGAALDWNTDLPWVDLDAEWWAQDAKESFTIKNHLYLMTGDINVGCLSQTKAMFFNMAIFDEFGWEYPYEIIRNGEWTLEKMSEYIIGSTKELNGDNTLSFEHDRLGFASTWWGTPINVLFTAGQRICDLDNEGNIMLTLNNERTVEVYDTFFKLMENPACYIHKADDGSPLNKAFREGRLTFIEYTLGVAGGFRDMEQDFGIIPCPKFDSAVEKYITGVDASTGLIVVPITAADPERTSAILELMAYYGWKDVIPTYYDVALSVKFARDEASVEMLDIIRKSRMFDTGYYMNDVPYSLNSIGFHLCNTEDHSFSSYYAAQEAKGLAAMDRINELYSD